MRRSYALLALALSACVRERDLRAPADRPTTQDAYTETAGTGRIDVAIGGTTGVDVAVAIGVRVGLPARFEVGANFAHYGAGMFNASLRWNPVDLRSFALGVEIHPGFMRPQWMWYLDLVDPEIPGVLAKMTLMTIPIAVVGTFPVADPVLLTVALGYDHTEIFGTIDADVLWFEGSLGSRRLWAGPAAHFLVGRVLVIEASAKIPIATWVATAFESSSTVEDGVVVGVRSAEWQPVTFGRGVSGQVVAELRAGDTHLRLGIGTGPLMRKAGAPVFPFLGAYWRIR